MQSRPIIVWLRRDLRIDDNTALCHASKTGAPVVPLFIFDTELIRKLPCDGATFDFQAQALRELAASMVDLGGRLILRHGKVLDIHKHLIQEVAPVALYFSRDYEPYAKERDARVIALYRSHGIDVQIFKDAILQEPDQVLTNDGKPFVMYTPFSTAWKRLPTPAILGAPSRFSTPPLMTTDVMGAPELRKSRRIHDPEFSGGESKAKERWKVFQRERIGDYQKNRDLPGVAGTSQMSAYLRFGCISIRRIFKDCSTLEKSSPDRKKESIGKYIDELIWREFYQSVLFHFPQLLDSNYRQEFDRLPWKLDERLFKAWREGRTGYPLVDAGMRQLRQTGWMHNRVRMVVASFLTKDMMHDWKLGAHVFEERLLDIETASNNGGWQWSASTGVDPRPLRIFNPQLQAERFDPEGIFIKRFVPELRCVPQQFVRAPHKMSPTLQKELGCVIGKQYPAPIVDHATASAEYKRVFETIKRRA